MAGGVAQRVARGQGGTIQMTANDLPSLPELRLLRRLRTLQNGMHLCIIHVDVNGIASLSIIGNGKLEKSAE